MIDLFGKRFINNKVVDAMPYMGSKRKLATKIINTIYQVTDDFENFYDVFGGGAAVSVAALMGGHKVYYSDINTAICNLLKYIQDGGKFPRHWVSRQEYHKLVKGDDWFAGLLQSVWSFGNNQKRYLFGKEIED